MGNEGLVLSFEYKVRSSHSHTVYFSFCFPFSYSDCQHKLNELDKKYALGNHRFYYHRYMHVCICTCTCMYHIWQYTCVYIKTNVHVHVHHIYMYVHVHVVAGIAFVCIIKLHVYTCTLYIVHVDHLTQVSYRLDKHIHVRTCRCTCTY